MLLSVRNASNLIRAALLIATVGVSISIPPLLWSQSIRLQEGRRVTHTWEVLANLQQLNSQLISFEVEGRSEFNLGKIKGAIFKIKNLTSDNLNQQKRLARLVAVLDDELKDGGNPELDRDRQIQNLLFLAIQEETGLLKVREQRREAAFRQLLAVQVLSTVIIVGTMALIVHLYHKNYLLVEKQAQAIAGLTHDARGPITAIYSSIEILMMRYWEQRDNRHLLKIQTLCKFLVELLEDVQFFTEPILVRDKKTIDVTDFCSFLTHSINAMRESELDNSQAVVRLACPPNLHARLDRDLTRRALYNLLINAVNYSNSDSIVEFDVSVTQTHVRFSIADRGRGIPIKERRSIFEPFRRGTNTGGTRGTGMGLAIAKRSVEVCGGKIWFEPRTGGGTIFYVELPIS
jgi:signal transduction histidine kinase